MEEAESLSITITLRFTTSSCNFYTIINNMNAYEAMRLKNSLLPPLTLVFGWLTQKGICGYCPDTE